jgi:hypothetical protein
MNILNFIIENFLPISFPCIVTAKATSYEKSGIQQLLSFFSLFSDQACMAVTALLNYNIGKYLSACCTKFLIKG